MIFILFATQVLSRVLTGFSALILVYVAIVFILIPLTRKKAIILSTKIWTVLNLALVVLNIMHTPNLLLASALILAVIVLLLMQVLNCWIIINTSKKAIDEAIKRVLMGMSLSFQESNNTFVLSSPPLQIARYSFVGVVFLRFSFEQKLDKIVLLKSVVEKFIRA